jgi:predicted acetyltransferase
VRVSTATRQESIVRPFGIDDPRLDRLIDIWTRAYTAMNAFTPDARQQYIASIREYLDDEPGVTLWAAERDGAFVGAMRLHDFTMRIRSAEGLVGGVGMVGVDLLHKKEGVARDLIAAYLSHYRERGATMAILHPFRPDFYRRMGFGYGTKMNQYRLAPTTLTAHVERTRVRALGPTDTDALLACYDRVQARTNGLIRKTRQRIVRALGNQAKPTVGYAEGDTLRGFLTFGFRAGQAMNTNDLIVSEMIYETPAALAGLLAFLQSQADQFATVVLPTQEEDFHFLPSDPRNGTGNIIHPPAYHETNTQGHGVMYRVIDTPGVFALLRDHDFGGQSCTLRLTIEDSFFPANAGTTTIRFTNGYPEVVATAAEAIDLTLDVSDFSALLIGSVRFRTLHMHGRARVADPAQVATIDRLFLADAPPICTTGF